MLRRHFLRTKTTNFKQTEKIERRMHPFEGCVFFSVSVGWLSADRMGLRMRPDLFLAHGQHRYNGWTRILAALPPAVGCY